MCLAIIRGDPAEIPVGFFDFVSTAPPIPVVKAGLAAGLFVAGRTDEAQAIYETVRDLPAAGDRDVRTVGALTQMMDLIIAFRDTEMAESGCTDLPRTRYRTAVCSEHRQQYARVPTRRSSSVCVRDRGRAQAARYPGCLGGALYALDCVPGIVVDLPEQLFVGLGDPGHGAP